MHHPKPTWPVRLAGLTGAVLLLMPLIVAGADRIEGQIDGDPRSWHVLEFEGDSTATFHEFGHGMVSVSIQGHQEPRFQVQGTISIDFAMMGNQVLGGAEVAYFPEPSMVPNYTNDGEGRFELLRSDISGPEARFEGRFAGTLARTERMGDEPNPGDTIEVELYFDVTAKREEF
jgi:hypothetical protein